ncbi:SNF2 domain-containing protein CLASSY 2 [Linum grandiflorum]
MLSTTTTKRRRVHESRHGFHDIPFEAFCCESWRGVRHIEIRHGRIITHYGDHFHLGAAEKSPLPNLRVRSRQATASDCICFLRPGIDVNVLSSALHNGDKTKDPVRVDAKIKSIARKPHDGSHCSCQFSVKLYANQGVIGMEKATLSKTTDEVGIEKMYVLQKLDNSPCEGRFYRWAYSVDCVVSQRTKLFLGKFCHELTWLLATSVLKHIAFVVRSLQNKIMYQTWAYDEDHNSNTLKTDLIQLNCITFKVENDILTPVVQQYIPDSAANEPAVASSELVVVDLEPVADQEPDVKLRRSGRRRVQPDRFLGGDHISSDEDPGWVRQMPYKTNRRKEEEEDVDDEDDNDDDMYVPLSQLFRARNSSAAKHQARGEFAPVKLLENDAEAGTSKQRRGRKRKRKSELSIVPVPDADADVGNEPKESEQPDSPPPRRKSPPRNDKNNDVSFGYYSKRGTSGSQRKSFVSFSTRNPSFKAEEDLGFQSGWGSKFIARKPSTMTARYRSFRSRRDNKSGEQRTFKKTALSAGAYNKLINSYMKNIDSTISSKSETHIIDQWERFKAKGDESQTQKTDQFEEEDDGEVSETEMLWREMELCLASGYIFGEDQDRPSTKNVENEEGKSGCLHAYKLDEEIGIICTRCGFVKTEIKYVTPPFAEAEYASSNAERKPNDVVDDSSEVNHDEEIKLFTTDQNTYNEEAAFSADQENVWALVPHIKTKLHVHQKKAFEFLWKNTAGSMIPAEMVNSSKKIGGCVVSHTPGAGKTFLIIAFLSSFLRLFPNKRPLVLAPKTTLYTWYKEFIKWEIPIPVHLIHGRKTYRLSQQGTAKYSGGSGPKPSQDVMHILDCLEKIQKWHAQPSVLVMGYTSFLTLMREDSKFAHRQYMAKVLRESPGLLILDEGHNPRSTKSRLRKVLMKVDTDLRILLSGTLFQNNFVEYFNTLCLARPKFIREVLKKLDSKFKTSRGPQKARHLLEARARKLFIDKIASKIDSDVPEERMEGLNVLRRMTNGFIDVYEGGASDGLPGLQIYTIMMNSTDVQNEILNKLHDIMATYHGYPLELELMITLASIHPWLVKTSNCVHKFFNIPEQVELERLKFDFKKGSKVMFVLNLVYRIVQEEKALIFCHNIAPITLLTELFESIFGWQKGREIMILTGDLELFERGRIIDKFEEPGGHSKILLASITACAEGISLTAASRVILLDSEWNPSKTKQAIARAFRPGQQKVVYVYQLLATGTLEEDKYRRTTWKEWVSCMIFSEAFVEDPSQWQAEKIEDEVLRQMVEEDRVKSFHMIMKNEKASITGISS